MDKKDKTLRQVILEHVLFKLKENNYNRMVTAKNLDISIRGLRNFLAECRQKGLTVPENPIIVENRYKCESFPSSEARLKNLDEFPSKSNGYHYHSSIIDGELVYRRIKDAKIKKCET